MVMNSSPGDAVFVQADGEISLVAGHVELVRDRTPGVGQAPAQRPLDDALDDLRRLGFAVGRRLAVPARPVGLSSLGRLDRASIILLVIDFIFHVALRIERLAQLAAVAVEGVGLEAQFPAQPVRAAMSSTVPRWAG
jgi:hypothetical protein